jgi:predicted alpha/beta hydrolase
MGDPQQRSLFLPAPGGAELHLRRIEAEGAEGAGGDPVLMLHGSVENGRVFYTPGGKGLGPFLARGGHPVHIADQRGRGESRPHVARGHRYGQTETITEDLPAFHRWVRERHPGRRVHWVAHSWGGVLMLAALGRFPELRPQVASLTLFGSKRCVRVHNLPRLLLIELYWLRLAPRIAATVGYLPSRRLGLGSDDESVASLGQCCAWVRPGPWLDPRDGFDYGAALLGARDLPPAWYLAAVHDPCLGHPDDVRDLMTEAGQAGERFALLGRAHGNLHDYDHVGMLTHADAPRDHFPRVAAWMAEHDAPGE